MAKTEIIGLIRFSFLGREGSGTDGFATRHQSTDEKRAFLYDPERLEFRLKLFEIVTLQSLLKQTQQDFKVILMIGEDFPDWALARLQKLIINTQIHIEKKPVMSILKAMGECFDKHFSADCETRITFRLDDDDAISLEYLNQVVQLAPKICWDDVEGDNFVVFLRHGIVLHNHREFALEHGYAYPVRRYQPWSVGTAMISKNGGVTHAYSMAHIDLCKVFPSQHMSAEHALLRVFHGTNDMFDKFLTFDIEKKKFQKGTAWIRRKFNDFEGNFGIDLEALIAFLEIDDDLLVEKLYN